MRQKPPVTPLGDMHTSEALFVQICSKPHNSDPTDTMFSKQRRKERPSAGGECKRLVESWDSLKCRLSGKGSEKRYYLLMSSGMPKAITTFKQVTTCPEF